MSDATSFMLHLPDGRSIQAWAEGEQSGFPLLFVTGTPSGGQHFAAVARAALEQGWRVVSFARPGYAGSTAQPGRGVADFAADAAAVLDHLGHEEFVVAGWSGGGPHALACAALLPGRCRAAGVLAGVAPYPAAGIDWMAGMGAENVEEFGAALEGAEALDRLLAPAATELREVEAAGLVAALGDLLPAVDATELAGEFGAELAASFRAAVEHGATGWRDDDLAFTRPWGFDLAAIDVPVTVWQGGHDRMVPADHGRWIARQIREARYVELPDDGHLTLITRRSADVVADLAGRSGG